MGAGAPKRLEALAWLHGALRLDRQAASDNGDLALPADDGTLVHESLRVDDRTLDQRISADHGVLEDD